MSFNVKALGAFKKLGAVALITATIFFVACKQTGGGGDKPKPKHAITFSVESTTPNGTLKAKAEGLPETEKSPITIEQGKVITFKAEAKAGYSVKSWTLDGKPITLAGTKAEYQHTVTAPCTIKVSFLAGGAAYTVKHYQERAEGGYPLEPTESETLNGTVDGEASYTAKTYEGFTQKADFTKINGRLTQTGTVLADGNTVVELFYERNTVSLTFHLAGGNIEGKTDDIVKTGKYGTPFTAPEPAKATGVFKGWKPELPTPLLFPASNAEHTAEWTPKALLTLEAGKNTVKVKAKTADGSAIKVEGCSVNELANEAETTLTVTDSERKLALIGDIIELNCSGEIAVGGNRPLIALDASGLTALQKLDCRFNKITALDVSGLTALQELYCRTNQIPELNVQGLTKLQKLDCQGNKLSTLNVQGLKALKELQCNNNDQLATLDVQGCTSLQKLICNNNQLTALDVQGLTSLQELNCRSNKLTSLNVQGLTELQELYCGGNQLTALNVQGCTALQELNCGGNQLATLDVSGLTALQKLYCSGTPTYANRYLSELNVQGCTSLKTLRCYYNKLNADVFTKLLNDLPTREVSDRAEATLYVELIDPADPPEGNCKNFSTPESLKKAFENAKNIKHWKLQKMAGYIEEDI